MSACCVDPPKEKNPGLRPGFQTESSLNNSGWAPERNLTPRLNGGAPDVKPPPQSVGDINEQSPIYGAQKRNGSSDDQQRLLNRIRPQYHLYALLLALHGQLTEEHCQEKAAFDNWDTETMRRVNQFS